MNQDDKELQDDLRNMVDNMFKSEYDGLTTKEKSISMLLAVNLVNVTRGLRVLKQESPVISAHVDTLMDALDVFTDAMIEHEEGSPA